MRPHNGSPPGSPVHGILQARTLEWVAISFPNARKWKVKVKLLSRVQLLATLWTAAYQAPPSMGFSRQEYWSGVPLQCGAPGFNSWVRKISWRKEWLPTPVFLPGEFHGQSSLYSNDIYVFKCQNKAILSIAKEKKNTAHYEEGQRWWENINLAEGRFRRIYVLFMCVCVCVCVYIYIYKNNLD